MISILNRHDALKIKMTIYENNDLYNMFLTTDKSHLFSVKISLILYPKYFKIYTYERIKLFGIYGS